MAETNAQIAAIRGEGKEAAPGDLSAGASTRLASRVPPIEEHLAWPMISHLPVMLAVKIPLSGLKVRNLLELRCGQTVESAWAATEDVPLKVGVLQICWGEFEVVEQRMALRLTRLA